MSLKRKIVVNSLDDVKVLIQDLIERLEHLEKLSKVVYHKQNSAGKTIGSTLYNMSSDISNANRKISQVTKR